MAHDENFNGGLDRRVWLKTAAIIAGTAPLAGAPSARAGLPLPGMPKPPRRLDPAAGLSVILLGTGTPLPNPDRACAATLVIAGDRTFLVDTGRGFLNRLADAGFSDATAVLFTHFHSDHFAEFGEFMVNRTVAGATTPLPVIGPAGAAAVVGSLLAAYGPDTGWRQAHHKHNWHGDTMKAEVSEKDPGVVWDRDGLKVTMIEVDHLPVKPAVGYRFDYRGKSAVVSGDTKKCQNLIDAAKGCDLLVHEALNQKLTEAAVDTLRRSGRPEDARMAEMATDLLDYHTTTEDLAEVARDCGAKKLVITHLAPRIPANPAMERLFIAGMERTFRGPIVVGRDGMEIDA